MEKKFRVVVLGGGAFGSALACVAARAGHETRLWARSQNTVDEINLNRTNSAYLGPVDLAEGITAGSDLSSVMEGAKLVLIAVPAQQVGSLVNDISSSQLGQAVLVTCAKGIDRNTGLLPSQLLHDAYPDLPIGVLSGPSFAIDMIRSMPTAVTVAANDISLAEQLSQSLSEGKFRCYASDDPLGVELGGALKNVLALAVGAARGMGLGASAEAALIARGFAEIRRLSVKLGAKRETLVGLSGLGDLVLTCSSTQSRNFTYGMALGRNDPRDHLPLAEGAYTASIAQQIAARESVDAPLIDAVVAVLEGNITASEAVTQLLMRPLKREEQQN